MLSGRPVARTLPGSGDGAVDFGSKGRGFKSLRARSSFLDRLLTES